jgi:hypothetical protein
MRVRSCGGVVLLATLISVLYFSGSKIQVAALWIGPPAARNLGSESDVRRTLQALTSLESSHQVTKTACGQAGTIQIAELHPIVAAAIEPAPWIVQCFEEHETYADQRVCIFQNLVVRNNTIYYVSSTATQLPQVSLPWPDACPA